MVKEKGIFMDSFFSFLPSICLSRRKPFPKPQEGMGPTYKRAWKSEYLIFSGSTWEVGPFQQVRGGVWVGNDHQADNQVSSRCEWQLSFLYTLLFALPQ